MRVYSFPSDFVWGTATAAHQIEGHNTNSDWWKWEQNKKPSQKYPEESSGEACDSYHRYEEDFDICREFNQDAVRFSVEWARIQPTENEFDQKEIEHYKNMIQAAKDRGLKVFLTLHHFTNPVWFAEKVGWHRWSSVAYFVKYAERCAQEFGAMADAIITINEPQVYALMSYTNGMWPPNRRNLILSFCVQINMLRAHRQAYQAIKKVIDKPIGIAKNIVWYETEPNNSHFWDRAMAWVFNFLNDDFYLWPLLGRMDFLGLNYYFTKRLVNLKEKNPGDYVSDLGWWIQPRGLGEILAKLKKYKLPIYITENGVADASDRMRKHFLQDMLIACGMAIYHGVDLRGYFHWSLIDNFEWHHGFWPRFGLCEIDREDGLKRKPRESFYYYADVCKNNRVEAEGEI